MQLQKNIPMPGSGPRPPKKSAAGTLRRKPYDWAALEVGDCYFFNGDHYNKRDTSNSAYMYGARNGKRFRCKRCDGGFRIWRFK